MFAIQAIEDIFNYLFYQLAHGAISFIGVINEISASMFESDIVNGYISFFQLFGLGLGVAGAAISIMDFAVQYSNGGGNFTGQGISLLRLCLAEMTFCTVPVWLYQFSIKLYNAVNDSIGAAQNDMITTAINNLFSAQYDMELDSISDVYSFVSSGLSLSSGTSGNNFAVSILLELVFMIWAIMKVYFGNLKRGGILMIQIGVGSLHMFNLARGYTDGFQSWCRQIIGTVFTAFVQNLMVILSLLFMAQASASAVFDPMSGSMLFGLGIMLAAAEVPRIAQMFGLDTSTKANVGGAIHTAQSAIHLISMVAK